MRPDLLRLGFELPLLGRAVLPAYFTLLMIGFSCAMVLSSRDAGRVGIDVPRMVDLNLYTVLFGLIGGRIMHVFADGQHDYYINLCLNPPGDCLAVFKLWRGGLTYYGGAILATAFGLYHIRRHRMPVARTADLCGFGTPLGMFFGRIGCYLNGCCYGKVTDVAWGAVFPVGSPSWTAQEKAHVISRSDHALPVHPTQLYEALGCLAIFAFLYCYLRPRKRFDGQLMGWFWVLYAILRFTVEIWRDDERGVYFGGLLSTSQIVGVPVLCAGVALLVWLGRPISRRPRP